MRYFFLSIGITGLVLLRLYEPPLRISALEGVTVDGSSEEWGAVPAFDIKPFDTTLTTEGRFTEDDLTLTTQLAWNQTGLYLGLTWEDDVLDTRFLPPDSTGWVDAEGQRRDRRYFYDHVAVYIRVPHLFYGLWLRPDPSAPEGTYQGLARDRPLQRDGPRYESTPAVAIRQEGSQVFLEVGIPWEDVRMVPSPGDTLDLQFIIPDSDWPQRPMRQKAEQGSKYLSWERTVLLDRP